MTVIELLIAAAVLSFVLLITAQFFASSRRAYEVSERVSEIRQTIQAALETLSYEIALAGYRCLGEGFDESLAPVAFGGRPFEIVTVSQSGHVLDGDDVIRIRYFEDRFTESGNCEERVVDVGVLDNNLVRVVLSLDGSTTVTDQLLVGRVTGLAVEAWVDRNNIAFLGRPAEDKLLAGVVMRISIEGSGDEVFGVGLPNPQCSNVKGCF